MLDRIRSRELGSIERQSHVNEDPTVQHARDGEVNGVNIRPLVITDANDLHHSCFPAESPESVTDYVQRALRFVARGQAAHLVAEADGHAVANAQLLCWRKRAEIGSLVVAEPLRRQGIGTALIEALSDENWQVRLNAAVALGEIGNPTATPALIAALNDENWEVRANVTIALGKMDHAAVPALVAALEDQDAQVRRNATRALGDIGDPTAAPGLIGVLNDEDWEVRAGAAVALGGMGSVAVPALIEALKDENEYAEAMATWALKLIGTPEALEAVKENEARKTEETETDAEP